MPLSINWSYRLVNRYLVSVYRFSVAKFDWIWEGLAGIAQPVERSGIIGGEYSFLPSVA
jgi:hypothetical protein